MFIFSGSLVERVTQTLKVCLIITLLSAPVIICNAISGITPRIIVIIIFLAISLAVLSTLTTVRIIEMFLIGAT